MTKADADRWWSASRQILAGPCFGDFSVGISNRRRRYENSGGPDRGTRQINRHALKKE